MQWAIGVAGVVCLLGALGWAVWTWKTKHSKITINGENKG
jgi:hypothetical protein